MVEYLRDCDGHRLVKFYIGFDDIFKIRGVMSMYLNLNDTMLDELINILPVYSVVGVCAGGYFVVYDGSGGLGDLTGFCWKYELNYSICFDYDYCFSSLLACSVPIGRRFTLKIMG